MNIAPETWKETRGRKTKYDFSKISYAKFPVDPTRARATADALRQAAKRQGCRASVQNHGDFLLVKKFERGDKKNG